MDGKHSLASLSTNIVQKRVSTLLKTFASLQQYMVSTGRVTHHIHQTGNLRAILSIALKKMEAQSQFKWMKSNQQQQLLLVKEPEVLLVLEFEWEMKSMSCLAQALRLTKGVIWVAGEAVVLQSYKRRNALWLESGIRMPKDLTACARMRSTAQIMSKECQNS